MTTAGTNSGINSGNFPMENESSPMTDSMSLTGGNEDNGNQIGGSMIQGDNDYTRKIYKAKRFKPL